MQRRRDSLAKFERDVLAHLPNLKKMAGSAYRLGKRGLLELLDATRSPDIRLDHLVLLEAMRKAELDILKASGSLPSVFEQGMASGESVAIHAARQHSKGGRS